MTSITTLLLLPLSLLALYHSITTEARAASEADTQAALALHKRSLPSSVYLAKLLRRRRSFEAGLRAPPSYSNFQDDFLSNNLQKRQEQWIWMPAHGYIPMPKDDSNSQGDQQDNGVGNLLRYG